jgi:isopentenyldiphosphate isomerase
MDIFAGLQEPFDILDEEGEKTGATGTYDEVHSGALLHRTVHVWVLNLKGQLLLQKRSKNVRIFPGTWDASATGHVLAGQESLEGARMEIEEELGLSLLPDKIEHIFTIREYKVLNEGTHTENAFNDVYLVRCDLAMEEFKIKPSEVEEIRWIDLKEFKEWVLGKGEPLVPHDEQYEKLLEYLDTLKN